MFILIEEECWKICFIFYRTAKTPVKTFFFTTVCQNHEQIQGNSASRAKTHYTQMQIWSSLMLTVLIALSFAIKFQTSRQNP